jgi:regulator of sigma E protease
MSIILLIVVLSILVFVHELGHFLFAKRAGIRVDEFAIGFPPRLFSYKPPRDETTYSINLIPFGGYVKIFGENALDEEGVDTSNDPRSFISKPRLTQALVLVAGVIFNALFAWLLFALTFMLGMPTAVTPDTRDEVENAELMITSVLPESPAADAGIKPGDVVKGVELASGEINPGDAEEFRNAIQTSEGDVTVLISREGQEQELEISPEEGIVGDGRAVGVTLDLVGTMKLPLHEALYESFFFTIDLGKMIIVGTADFLARSISGDASVSEVTGPVGIATLVGDAAAVGLSNLISFTAFFSLNLAILNLLPIPALDGGRLLFLALEALRGKSFSPKVMQYTNMVGFALLILLMIVVTVNDVVRLF